jgi:hypothetical protein
VAAFYAGNAFLTQAEEALRRRELPPPNDRQPPYLMLYEFTIPGRGNVRVELLDYAGELTDPRNINRERLADLLREHLRELDGLFVLAETPRPGQEDTVQPEELRRLQESFSLLQSTLRKGGRWNAPVALVLGKWDRRGKPSASAGQRFQETKEFLDTIPPPAVRQLCDMMRECATEGNFAVFAVSAFGPSVQEKFRRPDGTEGTRELPAMFAPLPAYGLENPFVWACQRRDQIDYNEYKAGQGVGGLLHWLNPLRPDTPWRSAARASRLAQQLGAGSPRHREVSRAWLPHVLAGLSRAVCLLVCLIVGWLAWEALMADRPTYRRVQTVLADRSSSLEQRTWAEQWLFRYGTSGPWRHGLSSFLVVSKYAALAQYEESVGSREEDLWALVEQESDTLARADRARVYLEYYPDNGKFTVQARALLDRARELREWQEVEHALARLEAQANEALASGSKKSDAFRDWQRQLDRLPTPRNSSTWPEELRKRRLVLHRSISERLVSLAGGARQEKERQNLAYLSRNEGEIKTAKVPDDLLGVEKALKEGLPYPDDTTEEIDRKKIDLQSLLSSRRRELDDRIRWAKIESEYDEFMQARNIAEAARVLVSAEEESERWKKKREDFRLRALKFLAEKSEEYRKERTPNFDSAIKILEDSRRDTRILALWTQAEIDQLDEHVGKAKTAKGKYLYDQLRSRREIADAERYLGSNGDQRMAFAARRHLDYLKTMANEQEVTLEITQISWGDWASGYTNKASVWLGPDKLIVAEVKSRKGGVSTDVAARSIKARVHERKTLKVYLWYPGTYLIGLEPAGVKTYTGRLIDFRDGKELELEDEEEDGQKRQAKGARMTLKVKGIAREPELPPWKE